MYIFVTGLVGFGISLFIHAVSLIYDQAWQKVQLKLDENFKLTEKLRNGVTVVYHYKNYTFHHNIAVIIMWISLIVMIGGSIFLTIN